MKAVMKVAGWIVAGWIVVVLLLPKLPLYYEAEHLMKPEGIVLSEEVGRDEGYRFIIKDPLLYLRDIRVARIDTITVLPWLFYDRIVVKGIQLDNSLAPFLPAKIDRLEARWRVWDPLHVSLAGEGEFGRFSGTIDVRTRRLHLRLLPSGRMKREHANTLRMMKKEGEEYLYESLL